MQQNGGDYNCASLRMSYHDYNSHCFSRVYSQNQNEWIKCIISVMK